MIAATDTFKYGQTVYHYLDIYAEVPLTVIRSGRTRTQVITQDDHATEIFYRTSDLWRG